MQFMAFTGKYSGLNGEVGQTKAQFSGNEAFLN